MIVTTVVNVAMNSERFEFETRNSDEIAQTASCYRYAYHQTHTQRRNKVRHIICNSSSISIFEDILSPRVDLGKFISSLLRIFFTQIKYIIILHSTKN